MYRIIPARKLGHTLAPVVPLALAMLLVSPVTQAQLAECDQIDEALNIDAAGSCIAKSLDEQIGAGHGSEQIYGSAVYLIKRDPARSIRRGRQLFQRKFTAAEGLGPRVTLESRGDITSMRALGAGLADSCAACHGRPRGAAGFGGDVVTFPDSRDAPHLFGLGLIEMLGDEITSDLRAIRDEAIRAAQIGSLNEVQRRGRDRRDRRNRDNDTDGGNAINADGSATLRLRSKGIDFGTITAFADGTVDTSGVEGVDEDLRVKPFFHDGRTASMREFIVGAFNDEMGMQAWDPVLCAVTDLDSPQAMVSPAGFTFDPEQDDFARPPACDASEDSDFDGYANEIDPALLDHMEFYLLNYFKPGQYKVTRRAEQGLRLMNQIDCTSCHVQNLRVDTDRRVADVETNYDPANGIFNDLFAVASTRFEVVEDGDENPLILPERESFVVRNVFTDLKRHNLGPEFAERDFDGTRITEHVTEPLWGVGSTAPYGHDGRSINLDAVIRRHGGDANASARAYESLDANDQRKIIEFLETLVIFPPDDTASNLNPGNPESDDPQNPDNHGNINLGALFQISEENAE